MGWPAAEPAERICGSKRVPCVPIARDVPRDWDQHYSDPANLDFTPSPLVVEVAELLAPGRALDLACGPGRNALYLASLGWKVTAVDSSPVAVAILRERASILAVGPRIDARIADMEAGGFEIEPEGFDLICDLLYLQRDLFAPIRAGVRPGGVFAGMIHLAGGAPDLLPGIPPSC